MHPIFKQVCVKAFYCYLISVLALGPGLCAQDVQFDRINKSDGFPSDWIYSLVQDQKGFLWVGGLNGLSRYDGYNIKTYRHNPLDSTSLSNNFVYALFKDRDGRLWLGTWGGGLDLFDPGKEIFTHYQHEPGNRTSLSSDSVDVIFQTRDGKIWVGTVNGLNRFDKDKGTFTRYIHEPQNERTLANNVVNALYQDPKGILWVGTGNPSVPTERAGGLNRYDSAADNFIQVLPRAQESLHDNRVTSIGRAPNDDIYIGTCQSGLYKFDPDRGALQMLGADPDDWKHLRAPQGIETSTSSAKVDVIHEDKNGMIWVATHSGGINRYDPTTHTLKTFKYQAEDPKSLSRNSVLSFYEDQQGIIWVGTEGAGLNKAVPSVSRFRLYGTEEISANNGVRAIYQDSDRILWIGTFSGQLFRMDPATGILERFSDTKPHPDGLWGNGVSALYKDREGMLWVGQQGGLFRIDPIRKTHRAFISDATNPDSLNHSTIMFFNQTDDQHLWIGTWGGGLNQYNFKTNRFRHFQHDPSDPKSLSENKLMQMYLDREGTLWITTMGGGINRFDEKTETFTTYLDGESVFQSYEDSKGRFWVTSSSNGIFLLDRNTGEAVPYNTDDGLPNNVVPGIMEDKQGLLWLSTSSGVARFDPEKKTFITYNEEDGLNNSPVVQHDVIQGRDGKLYIGGPNGVTAINPEDFEPNLNPPTTEITRLHVFEDAFPLPAKPNEQITLKYNQNELTFDYVGLHFANSSRNRYAYRLEGYDKNWNNAGTIRRAKYTNLSPGTYTFKVKSSNSDGIWDENGRSLIIKILPPWWRTIAAYIFYGLLGIAILFGLDRIQRRRLLAKEQARTRELELEQAREALQQASLDRVGAEIASMRNAKDLELITPLVWRELTNLGVPFFRCGVFIIEETTEQAHIYLSTPSGEAIAAFDLKFDSSTLVERTVQHWKEQKVYRDEWDHEQFIAWTQSLIDQGLIDNPKNYQAGEEPQDRLVLQFIPFTQGMLYIGSKTPLSEKEIETSQELAKVFGIAYARYEDFRKLESAIENLKNTQGQLIQAEKMASMGELTAGIAHEIQNPLNFVNNFSAVNKELLEEANDALIHGNQEEAKTLLHTVIENEDKIKMHGNRADTIVKSMLQHSRTSTGQKEPTDLNALCDEYLRLAYHGMRARNKDFNTELQTNFDPAIGNISLVRQDIGRVLLNLYNNAFHAVSDKLHSNGSDYRPKVSVQTKKANGQIEIIVKDNGSGIPDAIKEKIFQPFFTTKPTGQGTGLGLSLSYDIVKAHGGDIKAETTEGSGLPAPKESFGPDQAGTEFIISLPTDS